MGADDAPYPEDGEGPVRKVTLSSFDLAPQTVTNAEFSRFVNETSFKTQAERDGYSFVFDLLVPEVENDGERALQATWWHKIYGATWYMPEGTKGASIENRLDHPVVHISLHDAIAYCLWSGTRLPTEAEWEFAARGGLENKPFPWGENLEPDGIHRSNVWQGVFPRKNTSDDGYIGTAPAKCYEPNGYGLYNMTGNIWEWTADRFTNLHSPRPVNNPTGPLNGAKYVAKGGSYLCHDSYCARYRTSSRQALAPLTTAGNLGFRVAATRP